MTKQNRARVGVCGRNSPDWRDCDFQALVSLKAEAVKLMSFAQAGTANRIKEMLPDITITVRLYEGGFGQGYHPTPKEFVDRVSEHIIRLRPYANRFEIHNEPNHLQGIEGWGQDVHHANDFNGWFLEVYGRLKTAFLDLEFGFPGLAIPHRDLAWLEVCQAAIEVADFVGIHCYWQNPTLVETNHLDDFWGLRFQEYLARYPDKPFEITEYGNSNVHGNFPIDWSVIGREYVAWHGEVFRHPRIEATHGFILSAPQAEWDGFAWVSESRGPRAVVAQLGAMERPPLFGEETPPGLPPTPAPMPGPPPDPTPEPPKPPPVTDPNPEPLPKPSPAQRVTLIRVSEDLIYNPNAFSTFNRLSSGEVRLLSRCRLNDPNGELPEGVHVQAYVASISGPLADELWRQIEKLVGN